MFLIGKKEMTAIVLAILVITIVSALPYLPPGPTPPTEPGTVDANLTSWHTPQNPAQGQEIIFYADYSDGAGNPIITTCTINISGETNNMNYPYPSTQLYYYNRTLTAGTHQYEVKCDSLTSQGTVTVSNQEWCSDGQIRSCNTGLLGICSIGTETCTNNAWGTCNQLNQPTTEICDNNLDDDCDGMTDEQDTQDCNDPPTFTQANDITINEGETINEIIITQDPENNQVTITAQGLPTGSTFTDNGDNSGTLQWQTGYEDAGTYQINLTATDTYGASTNKTITIIINNVNRPPTLNPIGNKQGQPNQQLTFTITAVDPDNDPLVYSAVGLPSGAVLNSSTGYFEWTPTNQDIANHQITFIVSDGTLQDNETITITIGNINRPPEITLQENNYNATINETINFTITAVDPDNDPLVYSAVGLPSGAVLNSSTGYFEWTPNQNQEGTTTITFTVSDGNLQDSTTITINVTTPPPTCQDGTIYGECSNNKPGYCDNGTITDRADLCGCPTGYIISGTTCTTPVTETGGSGGSGGGGSGGGSGGGGGGSLFIPSCHEEWVCEAYSKCEDGKQTRNCYDANNCGTTENKPITEKECDETTTEKINTNDETNPYPYILKEELKAQPGKGIRVIIKNDGTEAWDSLTIIAENNTKKTKETLFPGETTEEWVEIPISQLLSIKQATITLKYGSTTFDEATLPIKLELPEYGSYIEEKEEPELYIIIKNENNTNKRTGIEGLIKVKDETGKTIYEDYIGPYDIKPEETIIKKYKLPKEYFGKGDYELEAQFYEKGKAIAKTTSEFSYEQEETTNIRIIILIAGTIILVIALYLLLNYFFYKRQIK